MGVVWLSAASSPRLRGLQERLCRRTWHNIPHWETVRSANSHTRRPIWGPVILWLPNPRSRNRRPAACQAMLAYGSWFVLPCSRPSTMPSRNHRMDLRGIRCQRHSTASRALGFDLTADLISVLSAASPSKQTSQCLNIVGCGVFVGQACVVCSASGNIPLYPPQTRHAESLAYPSRV